MATIESDIQALLGALVSGRAYPMTAPDPVTTPYIIFQVITDVRQNHLEGDAGLSVRRFQFDAYGKKYEEAKDLASWIKAAMAASGIVNIHLSSRDLHEQEVQLYRVSMDFTIWAP